MHMPTCSECLVICRPMHIEIASVMISSNYVYFVSLLLECFTRNTISSIHSNRTSTMNYSIARHAENDIHGLLTYYITYSTSVFNIWVKQSLD